MATGQATSFLLNYSGESVKNEGTRRGHKSRKRPPMEVYQPYPSVSQQNVAPMPSEKPTRSAYIEPVNEKDLVSYYHLEKKRVVGSEDYIAPRKFEERVPTWSQGEIAKGSASSYLLGYAGESVGQPKFRKQIYKNSKIKQYVAKEVLQPYPSVSQQNVSPMPLKPMPRIQNNTKLKLKQYKTPKLLNSPKLNKEVKYKSNKNNNIITPKLINIKSGKYINSNKPKMYSTGKASKKIPRFKGF
jgi:hypothetical protein